VLAIYFDHIVNLHNICVDYLSVLPSFIQQLFEFNFCGHAMLE